VSGSDFTILRNNFGRTAGGFIAPPAEDLAALDAFAATVPEPGAIGVMAAAGLLLGRRRRNGRAD